jgi:phage FluMu protein Com
MTMSHDIRDARCECGNLLARLTPRGVEVKCRRCKRVVLLPITPSEDEKGGDGPP